MRSLTVFACLLAVMTLVSACDKKEEEKGETPQAELEAQLSAAHAACLAGDMAKAAPFWAYTGNDKAKKYKAIATAEDTDRVSAACGQLTRLEGDAAGFEATGYKTEKESEGTWHILEIKGKKSGKEGMAGFLEIDGKYVIGDID